HSINITLFDERGATNQSSTSTLNFSVQNTNDAPFFINPPDTTTPVILNIGTVVRSKTHNSTIYAQDFDLSLSSEFANETLTYSTSNPSPEISSLSITKLPGYEDRARVSFIPLVQANASFLIRVTDSQGEYTEQNITFEILSTTDDPEITQIKPFL